MVSAWTISGTAIQNPQANAGGTVSGDQLTLFVVDTSGNGFSSIAIGQSLVAGTFIGGGDDLIVARGFTYNLSGFGGADVVANANLGDNGADAGEAFAVVFFDGLSKDATVASSSFYGVGTNAAWVLPDNNGATAEFGANLTQLSNISASLQVQAVPEPSVAAALSGIFALFYVMLRRRNT